MSTLPENNSQVRTDFEDNDFEDNDFEADFNKAYEAQEEAGNVDDNGFPEGFDEEYSREFDAQEAAAAAAPAPALLTDQQEEAGTVDDNGFPEGFDEEYSREFDAQEAAAALATNQQARTMVADNESQVDEDAESNDPSDDIQKLLARVAADERKAVKEHPRARFAQLLGMRINEHGILRPKCTVEERKAKLREKQARREAREQAEREKRIAGYKSLGVSKLQAICLD
ncbi:hypothetical protein BCIN_09g02060 [Botrytis cinerea B05.10]|uniref:Uncharacterized protein n=2 Tax=Botryotinia fuckeliana TaxID=40559 RepID=A0A384JRW9_BOTFB|nr:hypothetical protein BCIN_09g02060 [Botrytis cinerea B05.10]ATZ53338.1 hypothetical protein BCIN_09g02060 [Botrytis cinerea B05.10]EMR88770.1 hypothetical protein BcDW1_2628 [Botrytis cinerea BcDW1]